MLGNIILGIAVIYIAFMFCVMVVTLVRDLASDMKDSQHKKGDMW